MRSLAAILLCLVLPNAGIAQHQKFEPSYYISRSGDTTKGYASVGSANKLTYFKFKYVLEDDHFSMIDFDTCKLLVAGDELFINWFGKRGISYIDKFTFEIIYQDSSITGTIPLKQLYKGKLLSLYYYRDVTDHFFVGKENTIQELTVNYRYITAWEKLQYVINPPNYFITPVYRYQLTALMKDGLTKKQGYLVEETLYEKRSMLKLFKALNR